MSTATHADEFKHEFYVGIKELFAVDQSTEQVLVTYGAPASYAPPDIVSFLNMTAEQTSATYGNRGREETLLLTISISCVVNGGQEAELLAAQRAYSLLRQIEYYARSGWADRAPLMVQTLMIESFENSKKIVSVGRESIGLRADFILKTELRELQAVYYNGAKLDGMYPASVPMHGQAMNIAHWNGEAWIACHGCARSHAVSAE